MQDEIDALCEVYEQKRKTDGVSQKEIASLEHKIWTAMKAKYGTGLTRHPDVGERRDWFVKQFGGSPSKYEYRFTIYNLGDWAHQLYDLVDKGAFELHEAKSLAVKSKELSRRLSKPPVDILQDLLKGGDPTVSKNGHKAEPDEDVTNIKGFQRQVSRLASLCVEEALQDMSVEDYHRETLVADFKDSLDLLIRDFGRKISNVKKNTKVTAKKKIGAVKFNWACEVLGLKNKFGDELDMAKAKARKNKRALELHPDRNPGNPHADEELDRVIEAYEILEAYSSMRGKSNRHA